MLFLCSALISFGENKTIDSLENEIRRLKSNLFKSNYSTDTAYISTLLLLSNEYYISKPETAYNLCREAEKLSKKINYTEGLISSYGFLAYFAQLKGLTHEALHYYELSIPVYLSELNYRDLATTLNNISRIYLDQGDTTISLDYYTKGLFYSRKASDSSGIGLTLNNIGFVWFLKKDLVKAHAYFDSSLSVRKAIHDLRGVAEVFVNLGAIFRTVNNPDSSLYYFSMALKIQRLIQDKRGLCYSWNNIGHAYFLKNDVNLAIKYADSSLAQSTRSGLIENSKHAYELLYLIYYKKKNITNAFEYYKLYIQARDSINNDLTQKSSIRLQTKYEYEKTRILKEQEERERKRQEEVAVDRRNKLQYSIILIVVVALMSALLLIGKIRINSKLSGGLIFLTFLILFEFLLVLADPYIESVTGGAPGLKLLCNAIIAAGIFPIHAFIEEWMRKRLMNKN